MASCSNCKYAIYQDTGYSNYTVMGTDFYCGKKLHPKDGFDVFYDTDPGLEYADKCTGYTEGERIEMDCDGENTYSTEQKAIIDEWNTKP